MFFFSWSKKQSLEIAHVTASLFEAVTSRKNEIWLSDISIQYGNGFFESLTKAIDICEYGVFFLTKENIRNPWINFEAGGIFCNKKRTWCILSPNVDQADLSNTPFVNIQTIKIKKRDFEIIFSEICKIYNDDWNEYYKKINDLWNSFYSEIRRIINNKSIGSNDYLNTDELISSYLSYHSSPISTNNITFIANGYETHELYEFVLNNCKKRLWVYGRKNKKLFDNEHINSLAELGKKIVSGLDFRCLFFDNWQTGYVENLLQKKRSFKKSLDSCINDALDRCEEVGINPKQCFRYYSNLRNTAMIVIDDTIMYSHVEYTLEGTPKHLTNSSFSIVDSSSKIGENYISEFESVWEASRLHE